MSVRYIYAGVRNFSKLASSIMQYRDLTQCAQEVSARRVVCERCSYIVLPVPDLKITANGSLFPFRNGCEIDLFPAIARSFVRLPDFATVLLLFSLFLSVRREKYSIPSVQNKRANKESDASGFS